jgi:hypothetical protein
MSPAHFTCPFCHQDITPGHDCPALEELIPEQPRSRWDRPLLFAKGTPEEIAQELNRIAGAEPGKVSLLEVQMIERRVAEMTHEERVQVEAALRRIRESGRFYS